MYYYKTVTKIKDKKVSLIDFKEKGDQSINTKKCQFTGN
jgi:hypothetical protein